MSDFYNDSRQEYELETSSTITEIINVDNNDLLTPPATSDANFLIKLVSANNISQLYILQANASGEIRFLTLDAKNNNNQGGDLLYNTKIGADGKLYYYYSYDVLVNPLKFSGWYEVGLNIATIENGNIARDVNLAAIDANIISILSRLGILEVDFLTLTIEQTAINVNHEARLQSLEFSDFANELGLGTLRTPANLRDEGQLITTALLEITQANGFVPSIATAATRAGLTSRLSKILYDTITISLTGIGVAAVGAGIAYAIAQAMDDKKKEVYNNELVALNDTLQETPVSTAANYLIHTGLNITSGNTGFTPSGSYKTYRISIQREAVIIIFIDTTPIASVVNVEQFGTSTFTIGETISISKSLLGGGTGGNLVLTVASLGTFKEWTEARSAYLITKINGIDIKQRRKGGVIGADDIDTTQFTTTDLTYTDTTDPVINETITYKQLKSRLNLLPTGTSDVDVYTSTGKIGIGTTPAPYIPLHIYHATDSVARIQSGTSGRSSVEFMRGIDADAFIDYRFVNDTNLFRLQFQEGTTPTQFGDTGSYLMDASITKTYFYKDFQIGGRVGIGTTPHATINLDVNGSARLTGNVGIGTTPTASGDSFTPQLKIYSTGHTNLYMRGSSSGGSSGIEFSLGSRTDTSPDFRWISIAGERGLSLQYQDDTITYGSAGSDLAFYKFNNLTYFKDTEYSANVGIGISPDFTEYGGTTRLKVSGDTSISTGNLYITDGSVGIGTTEPNNKLHIQSTSADTRLIIEDMNDDTIGLPADIVFPDGGYSSAFVSGSDRDKWAYLANDVITASKVIRFTLLQRMEVDLLMVGGGGAGGHFNGGGGGGGGIFYGVNLILEAGNYAMIVGRGGVGLSGSTTQRSVNANGEPTMLCYDDGIYLTPVKFNLGGVIQNAVAYGGGSGATNNAVPPKLTGWDGGSGGGATETSLYGYGFNAGGLTTQPATFYNEAGVYEVGGQNGRSNTTTANDEWGGGGGGGTSSAPSEITNYTCGKRPVQVQFIPYGDPYSLSAGGGSATSSSTDLTATHGIGGRTLFGDVIGGYGSFWNTSTNALSNATNGTNQTGSGGGGSGRVVFSKAGDGGTGIAMIRYRLAERLNSSSLDFYRNQSSLIGYSIGNYEGQFKVYKDGIIIPSILINSLGNVAIKSRYNASQIFQVGEKGGRLRIANNDEDFTQIGVNDEYTGTPNIKLLGTSRTDGRQGNIEYTAGGTGKHIFTGSTTLTGSLTATGLIKGSFLTFHAVASHGLYTYPANTRITGITGQGWDTQLSVSPYFQPITGIYSIPTAGVYLVSCSCYLANSNHSFSIRLNATTATNGIEYGGGRGGVASGFTSTATAVINCVQSDTSISVWSGANGVALINSPVNSISIYLLMAT